MSIEPTQGNAASFASRHPPAEVPWTEEYGERHIRLVSDAMDDRGMLDLLANRAPLPPGYGVGFDERVVEFPWLIAAEPRGRILDAGSTLNHLHVLDRVLERVESVCTFTLSPEPESFPERGVSYVYGDLRETPFRDSWFDTVVCLSTLEHIGMDNKVYGADLAPAANPAAEVVRALTELKRVLRSGGRMLISVPYGRRQSGTWYRQFDRAAIEDVLESLSPEYAETYVFAYSPDGWQVSDLDAAAEAEYHDYFRDPRPAQDLAPAARAVACIDIRM